MRSDRNRRWRTTRDLTNRSRGRVSIAAGALIVVVTTLAGAVPAFAQPASYRVTLLSLTPPKLAVTADLPVNGQELVMDSTRPAGIPELDAQGWPAIISYLKVSDTAGRTVGLKLAGDTGWKLEESHSGRLTIDYEVDYSLLASHGWPAPRESGVQDDTHLVLVGRSLFITTREVGPGTVTFTLPKGWRPVTPWAPSPKPAQTFSTRSAKELVENLLVLTRTAPDVVTAGGFRLQVTSMGHWLPARAEVRRVLSAVVPRLVALMGPDERENYLVVQLPARERGGESFRNSFAMTIDHPPTRANNSVWGNTLAHEIFHYWNGWRLAGSDYAASQWFQEGFTEYAANLSMVAGRMIDQEEFLRKLSEHVANSRLLTTTLEGIGSRKGPPLYSAGALVAFSWDVLIRHASGGKRGIGDFLRTLWRQTGQGRRTYAWREIEAALQSTAPRDWDAFYVACIRGSEKLPLSDILRLAGLRLEEAEGAAPRIMVDPTTSASSRSLWQSLIAGR